jgi:pilin isopeptide linkage protein
MKVSKIKKRAAALGIAFLLLTGVLPFHAFASEQSTQNKDSVSVAFEVDLEIEGDAPEDDTVFTFILEADDGAPEPSSPYAVIKGEGETEFDKITYTEPGDYEYTIYERDDGAPNYIYDTKVYTMDVDVCYGNDGQLTATCSAYNQQQRTEKEPEVSFVNEYDDSIPVPSEDETTTAPVVPTTTAPENGTTKPSASVTKEEETTSSFIDTILGKSPKTGDETNIIPWLVLLCVAIIIIVGNIKNMHDKRRRKNK